MKLYNLTQEVDLPSGAVIVWTDSDTCPTGYSKVGGGYYVSWGSSYLQRAGESHKHNLEPHYHGFQSRKSDMSKGAVSVHSCSEDGSLTTPAWHSHYFPGFTTKSDNMGDTSDVASPGLKHVTIVLCRKD